MSTLVIFFAVMGLIIFFIILSGGVGFFKTRSNRAWQERYGPRPAIAGRPRQTRAKGLALAVLDSIPIVKFGSKAKYTDGASKDIELEEGNVVSDRETTTAADTSLGSSKEATNKETDGLLVAGEVPPKAEGSPEIAVSKPSNERECSICISDFVDDEEVRVLPCSHRFHPECIDPWLLNISGTCPICRYDLNPNDPTLPPAVELSSESGFHPEASPIPYVRQQALRDYAAHARFMEASAPNSNALAVPAPAVLQRERISIVSRLRDIRRAHSGADYVTALGHLYRDREHRRSSMESRDMRMSSSTADVIPGVIRPS
ncbi:hypothetical protein VTL71DRAFT_3794 [Oculimacula yallundae]|uniref:RING-type E3 ubiquitin transferase n=1 Tax=Oculimacula yallundae TaxID=86028 RepID=A0ABR4C589_9HELO